jgi:D-aminopeptidase
LSVNSVSIGEFGQLAMCASELGVRSIFVSGDAAMAAEAQALAPGIETVAVKWGVKPGTGEDLNTDEYTLFIGSARHLHPVRARRLIREGACRAVQRAQTEDFGIIPLQAPLRLVVKVRPTAEKPYKTIARITHPTSFIGLMNTSGGFTRMHERGARIPAGKRARKRRPA